jgi:RsiW-degrading membrane proteinase PrsW (M82 family)
MRIYNTMKLKLAKSDTLIIIGTIIMFSSFIYFLQDFSVGPETLPKLWMFLLGLIIFVIGATMVIVKHFKKPQIVTTNPDTPQDISVRRISISVGLVLAIFGIVFAGFIIVYFVYQALIHLQ